MHQHVANMRIGLAVLLLCLPAVIFGAGFPTGTFRHQGFCETARSWRDPPEKWSKLKKCPVNSLAISESDTGGYFVTFEFTEFASTPSYCQFAGIFQQKASGRLELAWAYKELAFACQLQIEDTGKSIKFLDPTRSCHAFCGGTNASINEMEFPKWDNPKKSPYEK